MTRGPRVRFRALTVAFLRHGRDLSGLGPERTLRLLSALESAPLSLLRRGTWDEWLGDVGRGRVTPAHLLLRAQQVFGPEAVFTTDSGNGTFLAMECLRLDAPGRFLAPVDYSCMGYAVPAAGAPVRGAGAAPQAQGVGRTVYATCMFCNRPLGTNQVLETFPVGRRLAFVAKRGRLWVVCGKCERWNLSPLEERWEAVEALDALFRGTRVRVSSENIGLARHPEGLELVRRRASTASRGRTRAARPRRW